MSLTSSCLASDGASKMLADLLQFQIDGLFSPLSSVRIKQNCSLKILEVCSNYDNKMFLKQAGVMEVLVKVLGLLKHEQDPTVRLSLTVLCWCFFASPIHSHHQNDWIETIFPHIFASCIPRSIQTNVRSTEQNSVASSSSANNPIIYRKRKFAFKHTASIKQAQDSDDGVNSTIIAIASIDQDLVNLIQQRWPNLFRLLYGDKSNLTNDLVAVSTLERSLCLCLLSRVLVTSVTCQSIHGGTTSLVSLSNKSFGASSSSRSPSNSQPTSSTSPGYTTEPPTKTRDLLGTYQTLLLRQSPPSSSSGSIPQSFLSTLAALLRSEVNTLLTHLDDLTSESESESESSPDLEAAEERISVRTRSDLFSLLTLLEAACFKCPENQV